MSMATLHGNEIIKNTNNNGQVFQATHMGDGKSRLPYMNRSFISFSYGGKWIENFDLIATFSNDRLSRNGYAEFEDNVTNYNNLDGQYYWGTHSKANRLDFTLSTDGIDQTKLDDFLYWFRAGETRELILAEHPNRAILARVAEPPQFNLLPFESQITLTISDMNYKTSTTLYKGEISLSFVMDEPYWYSIKNILGEQIEVNGQLTYEDTWRDANDQLVSIFQSKDALKILHEDGIPLGSMFDEDMLLGNGAFASVNNDKKSLTWPADTADNININEFLDSELYACTADTDTSGNIIKIIGKLAGAIVDASGNGISSLPHGEDGAGYFYYSGTAPAYTTITFTFNLSFNDDGYVIVPCNSHCKSESGKPYSVITIESVHKQELRFTTPNYLTSYNKAIEILSKVLDPTNNYSPENIRATLRDNVHHIYARSWAIHCIDMYTDSEGNWISDKSGLLSEMRKFLVKPSNDDNESFTPRLTVTFNSQTGEAKGWMQYYTLNNNNEWIFPAKDKYIEENVGDMLRSNHIIIKDRNYNNKQGRISNWQKTNKYYSHRIYHDLPVEIENFSIIYKNMYL